jgi:hypothetical protein
VIYCSSLGRACHIAPLLSHSPQPPKVDWYVPLHPSPRHSPPRKGAKSACRTNARKTIPVAIKTAKRLFSHTPRSDYHHSLGLEGARCVWLCVCGRGGGYRIFTVVQIYSCGNIW